MNNKPVAWMSNDSFEISTMQSDKFSIPLYTSPRTHDLGIAEAIGFDKGYKASTSKTLTEIIEKNKPEIEKVNAYIKSLEDEIKALKAKTLTDEEITELANQHLSAHAQFIGAGECSYEGEIEFARAILRKAQEK